MIETLPSPRAFRTRSALLSAGVELISERPIDAIAINDLVAAAGVAKGSFFNHFADKQGFADALADDIRCAIQSQVELVNETELDPLERLAGGMIVSAIFALHEPKRTIVLARTGDGMILEDHPLNRGLLTTIQDGVSSKLFRREAARTGVLFWLACCHLLMGAIVERNASSAAATEMLSDMLVLGLTGLGVEEARCRAIADPERLRRRFSQAIVKSREAEPSHV